MSIFGKKEESPANTDNNKPGEQEQAHDAAAGNSPTAYPRPTRYLRHVPLTPAQLERAREAKRLSEAKLVNIEDSIERLRTQQEWLRRYNEVEMALSQEKERLNSLNKQFTALTNEGQELERYELLEGVQGTFQRIQVLEEFIAQNKLTAEQTEKEAEQMQARWDEQLHLKQTMTEQSWAAEERLYHIMDKVVKGSHLDGAVEMLYGEINALRQNEGRLALQQKNLEALIEEDEADIDMTSQELERQSAGRQSMEMHEMMLENGDVVLLLLDRLQEIEANQQALMNARQEAVRRQEEENNMLGQIFSKYQEVNAQIDALNEEMKSHRATIQGQNSYAMQERAMSLKSRKQMLLSAQSLWNRISTGYNIIEEKTRSLNALRLKIEHTASSIQQMEAEMSRLERLCHEKEYTYLLSRSQNVIQLRSDLKEGTSCSVCGAIHHPYHSDTMLEQSKLIGEFKTDFELLDNERRNKKKILEELRLELADAKGRQQTEEANLASTRKRQSEDVREWHIFTSLDHSFQDCSATTNQEARQAMLRQLIENTTSAAEQAQKELDTLNYHQSCIYDISEKLQIQEQKKNELSLRLNEVNTGCQVMAGAVERIQQLAEQENRYYSSTYTQLERLITITDWLKEWKLSREGLKGRIQKLIATWQTVNHHIQVLKHELEQSKAKLETEKASHSLIKAQIDALAGRREICDGLIGSFRKEQEELLGKRSANEMFQNEFDLLRKDRRAEEQEQLKCSTMQHDIDYIRGRAENYARTDKMLAEQCAAERNRLDHWIRSFNNQHTPVQYAEMEKILGQERDWNGLRERLQKAEKDMIVSQTRYDSLNSRLVALLAEGYRGDVDTNGLQESLVVQRESMEGKKKDILIEIARQEILLEENEKAERLSGRLSSEEMA